MVDKIADYHDNVRSDVFPFIPTHAGRVLDFGGGVGATSAALKRDGRASMAIVADQVMETAAEIDAKVVADLDDPVAVTDRLASFGPFDTILCLDILEHLRDPWGVLSALERLLTPGGTVVISVPNVNYRGIVLPLLLRGSWTLTDGGPLDRTHLRWFTRDSVAALAANAGLFVERVDGTLAGRSRLLNMTTFGLLERFLAVQYVVRAVKRSG